MPYFLVSLAIVLLDQWSKKFMSGLLPLCEPGHCESIILLPVFRLTLLHNEGAAFSFLDSAGGWQRWFLSVVSLLVSLFIAGWLFRIYRSENLLAAALCVILGGAVGNLIDRVVQGYVVDFIVVHYEHWYFPAFNVADSAITVGAGLLILDMLLQNRREGAKDANE